MDGVYDGTMSLDELKWLTIQNQIIFTFCIFGHLTAWALTHKVTGQFRLKVRLRLMRMMVSQDTAYFDIIPSAILQDRLNSDAERLASKIFHLPLRLLHECRCNRSATADARLINKLRFPALCKTKKRIYI